MSNSSALSRYALIADWQHEQYRLKDSVCVSDMITCMKYTRLSCRRQTTQRYLLPSTCCKRRRARRSESSTLDARTKLTSLYTRCDETVRKIGKSGSAELGIRLLYYGDTVYDYYSIYSWLRAASAPKTSSTCSAVCIPACDRQTDRDRAAANTSPRICVAYATRVKKSFTAQSKSGRR